MERSGTRWSIQEGRRELYSIWELYRERDFVEGDLYEGSQAIRSRIMPKAESFYFTAVKLFNSRRQIMSPAPAPPSQILAN